MGLFDFLKLKKRDEASNSGSYIDSPVKMADFVQVIQNAIVVMQTHPLSGYKDIAALIRANCRSEALALALYRFIPMAYCRLFLPEAQYSDEYVVIKNRDEKQTFSLATDQIYQKVLIGCKVSLATAGSQENILNVLRHSPEFGTINDALNKGVALTDLICAPPLFV